METTILLIIAVTLGVVGGWGIAVIMMGAKISEANDIIFQKEVERRMELAKLVEDAAKSESTRKTKTTRKPSNPKPRK
jgi:hypothetical protein